MRTGGRSSGDDRACQTGVPPDRRDPGLEIQPGLPVIQEESIVYKSLLKKSNVDVISISEPLIDGPFGTLIERIIEWMDEYYSIRLSGEVLRGMKEKALQHGYQTTPCLGYQAAGGGNRL